jgi:predicted RNA-binding Zn-ribbon protein involved in translation (DUF1610 family)
MAQMPTTFKCPRCGARTNTTQAIPTCNVCRVNGNFTEMVDAEAAH